MFVLRHMRGREDLTLAQRTQTVVVLVHPDHQALLVEHMSTVELFALIQDRHHAHRTVLRLFMFVLIMLVLSVSSFAFDISV